MHFVFLPCTQAGNGRLSLGPPMKCAFHSLKLSLQLNECKLQVGPLFAQCLGSPGLGNWVDIKTGGDFPSMFFGNGKYLLRKATLEWRCSSCLAGRCRWSGGPGTASCSCRWARASASARSRSSGPGAWTGGRPASRSGTVLSIAKWWSNLCRLTGSPHYLYCSNGIFRMQWRITRKTGIYFQERLPRQRKRRQRNKQPQNRKSYNQRR